MGYPVSASSDESVGKGVYCRRDRELMKEQVECMVLRKRLVSSHDSVGKKCVVCKPLLSGSHWTGEQSSKLDGEKAGSQGQWNRGGSIVGSDG
jgi:hypothetical protein